MGTGIVVTPVISGLTLSNSNYQISGVTSNLTANITAAPVTVTASNQTTVYGTPLALGTSDFTTSGLLGSDSISSVTLTQLGNTTVPGTQNAGTYSGSTNGILASAANGTNLGNYQVTYVPGTLVISKKSINVVANDAVMTYADANLPTLSYQSISGLVNGDQISGALATSATAYSGVAGSASNVGAYFITQGTVTAGSNYEITYTRASLTVNPASLYITAENQSSTYGSLLVLPQSGSGAFSLVGLRNGDYVGSATVLYNGNQTVPGTTNAGNYAASVDISAATGFGMSNYNISYTPGDLSVAKASLLVTAVDSAKFVGTSDPSAYSGVMYSGFKNSDSDTSGALGSAVVTVSRTNSSVNDAGSYNNVLMPNVSTTLQNYTVQYATGKFVIVSANQLLVQVGSNTTVYGTAPTYSASGMTVSYCTDCAPGISSPNIVSISGANITVSGSAVTVTSGNTTAAFSLSALNPVLNSSGTQLSVGAYPLTASGTSITTSPVNATPNFNALTVVGGLTVTPLVLSYADLGVSGITQVYSGSVNMSNLSLTTPTGFLPGDTVAASAAGTFANKNVGSNIAYTIGVTLSGVDAANYQMNGGSSYTGTNGAITQLASVTYTGSNAGGNWSNPANWTTTGSSTVGAIPDLSNVATVIIPVGSTVIYDAGVAGPVTSSVIDNGNITVSISSPTTISMPISGVGTVTIGNTGAVTLSGDNSYLGGTILLAGSSLIAGSNNAISAGAIISNGTSVAPATFSTSGSVILPALNLAGGVTQIASDITTAGTQAYSGAIQIGSAGTTTLTSNNAAITLGASINSILNKTESLVVNAGSGVVTISNSVGNVARLVNFTVTGSRINLLADVLTGSAQTYNGAIYIGDASYVGQTPSVGFLYTSSYTPYFQYVSGSNTSTIDYLNLNPIYIRTLISLDPSITFNGAVNDITPNTHTLLVAAVAAASVSSSVSDINSAATITFSAPVGTSAPLYSLNTQTIVNSSQSNYLTSYVGSVSLVGGVSTYAGQTYRANMVSASAVSQPGTFTFSIYDPASRINYLLPAQTAGNSGCAGVACGQMNLQNPNHLDVLVINGVNNYLNTQNTINTGGAGYWNARMIQNTALGYNAPAPINNPLPVDEYIPPRFPATITSSLNPFVLPAIQRVTPLAGANQSNSFVAATIQNGTNFIFQRAEQNNSSVNVTMAPDLNVQPGAKMLAGMQVVGRDEVLPKSEPGMVNILMKVMINGQTTTLTSSSSSQGFKFQVPEALLPPSIVSTIATLTTSPTTGSVIERAVQSDGSPLPTWLKYDPETNTFSASQVPQGAKAVEIKIQTFKDGQVLDESPPIQIDPK